MGRMPRTRIVCWNCLQDVPIRFGGMKCPNCGALLTPKAYDARAAELAGERHAIEHDLGRLMSLLDMANRKNERWGRLKTFPLLPSYRAIKKLEPQTELLKEQVAELASKARLGPDRYYASEWFRQSRCFLRADTPDPKVNETNPFKTAYYDQNGIFHMLPDSRNAWKRGKFGEYVVFESLAAAMEGGVFGHARLLWHLYIPVQQHGRMRDTAYPERTDEIDIVLITTHGLYSIEVKSLHSVISVQTDSYRDAYSVILSPCGADVPQDVTRTADRGIEQNAAHVRALKKELAGSVPPQRIFNVTAYTNHCGFEMHAPQGLGGAFVATTSGCEQNIVDVIRLVESAEEACWTDAEVDGLADELALAYTDPDGSKRADHAKAMRTAAIPFAMKPKHHRKAEGQARRTKKKPQQKYQKRRDRFIEDDIKEFRRGGFDDLEC